MNLKEFKQQLNKTSIDISLYCNNCGFFGKYVLRKDSLQNYKKEK